MLQHPYWKPVHPRRVTTLLLYLISSRQTPLGTRVPWTPRCCALHMRTAVRSFLFRIIESRFMMDEQGALRGVFRSGHLAPAEFRTADTPPHTKRRLGKLCITGDLYRRLESSSPAGSRVSHYKQRETSLGYYSRLWSKLSVPEVTFMDIGHSACMPLVGFAHVVFTK
jgi:hypothetical protein